MKKNQKILSTMTGASMLVTSIAAPASVIAEEVVQQNEQAQFTAVANIEGRFAFDQDTVTPPDEVFNIFGTVLTAACAKPTFAMENEGASTFINVGGKIRESYSVSLKDLQYKQQNTTMLCACATGAAAANVQLRGVLVEDILEMAEIDEDANALVVRGSDGYSMTLPLNHALEKRAIIAYKLGDMDLPSGTQMFIPETVARYFTRSVVDLELTHVDNLPELEQRDDALRAEVAFVNKVEDAKFTLGEEIIFEGYADDLSDPITAVEFSMDNGETWTSYPTFGATADRWVYWQFAFTPKAEGDYKLMVQARTASGAASPLAAAVEFGVAPAGVLPL